MKPHVLSLFLTLSLPLSFAPLLAGCTQSSAPLEAGDAPPTAGQVLVVDRSKEIRALTTDGVDVYWIATEPLQPGGALRKVSTAGGEATTVATFDATPGPQRIAFDAEALYLVAGERALRVAREGGTTLVLGTTNAAELAVAGGYVYWAQAAVLPDASSGNVLVEVKRVPVVGGDVTTVGSVSSPFKPRGIVADARTVYVMTDGDVLAVPSSGGVVEPIPGLRADASALDADALYVAGRAGDAPGLFRVNRDGSGTSKLAELDSTLRHAALVLDVDSVYVSSLWEVGSLPVKLRTDVLRVPKNGARPAEAVLERVSAAQLAVDGSRLYWSTSFPGPRDERATIYSERK